MVSTRPQVAAGGVKRNEINCTKEELSPKIIPAVTSSNVVAGQSRAGVGRAGGCRTKPQNTDRVGRDGKIHQTPPKIAQNRRAGRRGRHICNNLLNEAIIDTGKTRGGPCSATCLVFVVLEGWEGRGETSRTKRTSFHRQRNTDLKATDIFTTTIKK